MRYPTLAVMMTAIPMAFAITPSFAATSHTHAPAVVETAAEAAPSFDDCFRLAWVRGVHVERYELDDFNAECLAGRVPFDSGLAVDSVKRDVRHDPHS